MKNSKQKYSSKTVLLKNIEIKHFVTHVHFKYERYIRFLCTALQVIARNMHTKFGMIWTYSDKIMLRTRKSRRRHHRRRK